jgi:hypothetical protein
MNFVKFVAMESFTATLWYVIVVKPKAMMIMDEGREKGNEG